MPTSSSTLATAAKRLRSATHTFLWDEWSQLGVAANPHRASNWAADPEATLVFTLAVARDEPRLFDEVLDWLKANYGIAGKQRALNFAPAFGVDRDLVHAVFAWASPHGAALASTRDSKRSGNKELVDLFAVDGAPVRSGKIDPAFAQYGFRRPELTARRHSGHPDTASAIGFAFRLRHLLGVSARAEALRHLLLVGGEASAVQIATLSGYSKRNVAEALNDLVSADVIRVRRRANQHVYSADRNRWGEFLNIGADSFPAYLEWPGFYASLWQLLSWFESERARPIDETLLASASRQLTLEIAPGFESIGMRVPATNRHFGAEFIGEFLGLVAQVTEWLQTPRLPAGGW